MHITVFFLLIPSPLLLSFDFSISFSLSLSSPSLPVIQPPLSLAISISLYISLSLSRSLTHTRSLFLDVLTDIDDCHSAPCQNNGTCQDAIAMYSCNCISGYHGSNCETGSDIHKSYKYTSPHCLSEFAPIVLFHITEITLCLSMCI